VEGAKFMGVRVRIPHCVNAGVESLFGCQAVGFGVGREKFSES
jgi:hypothetical protein